MGEVGKLEGEGGYNLNPFAAQKGDGGDNGIMNQSRNLSRASQSTGVTPELRSPVKDLLGSEFNPYSFMSSSEESSSSSSSSSSDDDDFDNNSFASPSNKECSTKTTNLASKRRGIALHARKRSENDKDNNKNGNNKRRNGNNNNNTKIPEATRKNGGSRPKKLQATKSAKLQATKSTVRSSRKIATKSLNEKSTGKLKEPPIYSKSRRTIAAKSSNGVSTSSRRQKNNGDNHNGSQQDTANNESSSSASTSVAENVARMPLPNNNDDDEEDHSGAILSHERIRALDHCLKEHTKHWAKAEKEKKVDYLDIISDAARRKIALMVPTTFHEVRADNVLDKATHEKYGERIVTTIKGFLETYQIDIKYVREKRKEQRNTNNNTGKGNASGKVAKGKSKSGQQAKPTSKSSPPEIIVLSDDSSDDEENETANESDAKKPKAKVPTKSKTRTRVLDFAPPKKSVSPSQAVTPPSPPEEPEEEEDKEEYNPFGDSWGSSSDRDSDSDSDFDDEKPKAQQIPTKSKKRTRAQRNSYTTAKTTTTTPHSNTSSKQRKSTATTTTMASKSHSAHAPPVAARSNKRKATVASVSTQSRKSNVKKHTHSMTARSLQFSQHGLRDSSDDGSCLSSASSSSTSSQEDEDSQGGILSTKQTEDLEDWILRKAKTMSEVEQVLGDRDLPYWKIISDDARKMAALLVPTAEEDLVSQRIFSDAERRLYGKFLLRTIQEFLAKEKISIAEVRRRRRDQAAARQRRNTSSKKKRRSEKHRHQTGGQLLEQGYCAEWIDKDGKKLCVYGTLTEFVPTHADADDEDKEKKGEYLSIEYAEHSRSLLNKYHTQTKNLCILGIQPVDIARAWGGCLLYQEKQQQRTIHDNDTKGTKSSLPVPIYSLNPNREVTQEPVPLRWRVPDLFTRSTTIQKSAPGMPSLCLHYSGFQLEFTVQPSTIPNSGNGVFLSITSLLNPPPTFSRGRNESPTNRRVHQYDQQGNVPVFSLLPGEVLDFGVYAPLTSEDETPDYIMLVRSFLQSFWCDSYSMNTRDNEAVYDITHGRGELIREAKNSVLPFVNESNEWQTHRAEVQLIDDPQGSFHYVLGYRSDDGHLLPFQQLADARPREIFVDYGRQYEMVRLRHGYPRIPVSNEEERKQKLDEDEREKLDVMFELSAKKLQEAIECVHDFVMNTMEKVQQLLQELHDDQNRNNTRERVLAAIIVLQARSEQLRPEVVTISPTNGHRHKTAKNLRRKESVICYNGVATNDVDFEGMSTEDWDTVDTQLRAIVEKLLPGSSPSSLLSSLKETNEDSLLGMACAIVAPQVKESYVDSLEDDYVEF
mmetsp:Transcript_28621/g.69330  ORF Transcript_28621/g.69330 Transcript_28621/m.69330 type:complete len:1322 (-) Transcript_28621:107-4072(-)